MKVIILAGGYGSRLGTVSELIPKPMVEVGGKPILWHIMKIYSHYGFNDFVIALGYKANVIKDYFYNIRSKNNDFTINIKTNEITFHNNENENWNVTLIDTGINTLKGARIKRLEDHLDDVNMLTYGDGVANVDINELINFHKSHGKTISITGVRPPSMFGEIIEDDGLVVSFEEKPQTSKGLINGGFMVFNKNLLTYLSTKEDCDFEFGPLELLASKKEVMVYKHKGFWECADTVRDVEHLNSLWEREKAYWKVW